MQIFSYNKKLNTGITLISLAITIIILIILAGIVMYFSLGNNVFFSKTKYAVEETNRQTATEKINLKITNSQIKTYSTEQRMPSLQEIADDLCDDSEIQYVTTKSKIASLDKIVVGTANSIFTKLHDYPYEFEINSLLQLASVDGKSTLPNNQTASTSVTNDELLINEKHLVVDTTTTDWVNLNIDFDIKSTNDYKYLLFTYGPYNVTEKRLNTLSTTLLSIDDTIYGTNSNILLPSVDGSGNYSTIQIYLINDHTIRITYVRSSNNLRTHFAITSIKGIK